MCIEQLLAIILLKRHLQRSSPVTASSAMDHCSQAVDQSLTPSRRCTARRDQAGDMLLHSSLTLLRSSKVQQDTRQVSRMLAGHLMSKHRQGCQASTLTHLQGHGRLQALLPDQALSS